MSEIFVNFAKLNAREIFNFDKFAKKEFNYFADSRNLMKQKTKKIKMYLKCVCYDNKK